MDLPWYGVCQHGVSDVAPVHACTPSPGKPMVVQTRPGFSRMMQPYKMCWCEIQQSLSFVPFEMSLNSCLFSGREAYHRLEFAMLRLNSNAGISESAFCQFAESIGRH